jgi:hypothetical protein
VASCSKFETLPDKIESSYEIAIPVIDTTVSIGNFVTFKLPEELLNKTEIPEGTSIKMGELGYPFFLGEFSSSSSRVNWIELFFTLETKDLPSETKTTIKIYTKDNEGKNNYFELPNDPVITNGLVKLSNKITNTDQFKDSRRIFFDISVTYPTAVSVAKVIQDKLSVKLAVKFEITDLTLNL